MEERESFTVIGEYLIKRDRTLPRLALRRQQGDGGFGPHFGSCCHTRDTLHLWQGCYFVILNLIPLLLLWGWRGSSQTRRNRQDPHVFFSSDGNLNAWPILPLVEAL